MIVWTGKIEICKISNVQIAPVGQLEKAEPFIEMKDNNVRFVHYPDCQQLIIWLTHPGREYHDVRLKNKTTNSIVETWPVTDRLNGSIQLLWDTLPIAPGSYSIEIDWKNGWQHRIEILKREKDFVEEKKEPDTLMKQEEQTHAPIVYRDSTGRIIGNEDLILRDKLTKDVFNKFSRRIEYSGTFRAGTIIYTEGDVKINFSHEMGGGNCMFYIDIPAENNWEAQTGTKLSKRKEILEFLASTVKREQAPNCRFEIGGDTITYYYH